MKRILSITLIGIAGLSLNAQNQPNRQADLDALYAIWQNMNAPDSSRVQAYKDYIWNGYLFSNPDSAAVLAEALHTYAQKHTYTKASATGYNLQGIANALQGNYPIALEYYSSSLTINEALGNKREIASSLNNIGISYKEQGNYPLALEYYQKSLAIMEEIGDKIGTARSLFSIGNVYDAQGNYLRALEYIEKALEISQELKDKKGIANSLSNIGVIQAFLGNNQLALECYQKALSLQEELGDKRGIATNLHNIGLVYTSKADYPRALEYFEKSLTLREDLGNKKGIASNLSNIGILYQQQGDASSALGYCQTGLALAEEIGALRTERDACQCLYDVYKDLNKRNEALVYLEKILEIEDSLNIKETTKKLEQMEFAKVILQDSIAKAEEDRRIQETHREEVRQKNQTRNVLIGSTLIFIILAGGLYSRWRYISKSRDTISKEKDRSEHLLLNILPAEVAQELKENGRAVARDFDMVSILFTDFKDFTEAAAKLSALELVHEINHCFEAFDAIVEKYGIEKIKTIGDAYMAAGGLPAPTDESVKNTVMAALEMQAFVAERKAKNTALARPAFEMRIGIHTGPVVAGIVGVKKFQYDIWGDTVNTASRMESSGEVGKVNISESTYNLVKDSSGFTFESRGRIKAKGKGEIEMYFVVKS